MIRILVAEDSKTTRSLLVSILRADSEVQVVGEANDGFEAVELTRRLRPDVITMDLRMPRLDGFDATRQIMVESPTPIVIVSASVDSRDVTTSLFALKAGALAVAPTPPGPEDPDFAEAARRFVTTIKAMSQVKVVRRWAPPRRESYQPQLFTRAEACPRVLAVAASTGGPAALARILSELPGDFPAPILAVQHMAQGFMEGLAGWLNTTANLRVKIAEDGEPALPRIVYLAPDVRHLGVSHNGQAIRISNDPPIGGFKPSATYLFDSVSRAFGSAALALILTGMGQDGVAGLRRVRELGGRVIAQDERTSVVFGMPGAAAAAGVVNLTLPLGQMAARIAGMYEREVQS